MRQNFRHSLIIKRQLKQSTKNNKLLTRPKKVAKWCLRQASKSILGLVWVQRIRGFSTTMRYINRHYLSIYLSWSLTFWPQSLSFHAPWITSANWHQNRTNGWTNEQTTWEHYVSACQSGLAETRLHVFLITASTDKIRLSWTRYGWHIYTLRQLLNVFTVFWHNKPWYQCQRQALSSHSTYLPAPVTSLLPSYYWYNLCLVTGRY